MLLGACLGCMTAATFQGSSPCAPTKFNESNQQLNLIVPFDVRFDFRHGNARGNECKISIVDKSPQAPARRHEASIDVRRTQEASRRPAGVSYLLPIQRMITTTTGGCDDDVPDLQSGGGGN
jgi:hypothetical protein